MNILYLFLAIVCAFFISVTLTPIVRVLAFKLHVTDVPKDSRRMHKKEMPLMGGLAIFAAFVIGVLVFCDIDRKIIGFLLGALLITLTGIIDDKYEMRAILKLLMQIAAALIAVFSGLQIEMINFFGRYIPFGPWSGVITVVWIVALTNAINLIDGLDGLSCGVSTISCFTLLISLAFHPETPFAVLLMIGILAGSCMGFLPFNFNPAKIFMGDTGALFLGYCLSVLSILGCFKLDAIVSFAVPFLIFALPLMDTAFAFMRRIFTGRSPFSADRGHVHHRLIDKGFDQRHSVLLLYAVSGISGIAAILISLDKFIGGIAMFAVAIVILILNLAFGGKEIYDSAPKSDDSSQKNDK
ncbi:MAG: undecaprenyl/decaprenyl-phosphate alpha-N-acetylglucosaminyl 1-phosphate transferase [Ruminococcaceae bacterium]|nr:undecaprenyl/decaprenyl-phosphate alpha-N-acetylglucosaminyl 1-phosphate transferase [Oscillospiraceae bacterium]